jgi:GR25 family glycosyltransferase involved in LPS biosynthesis
VCQILNFIGKAHRMGKTSAIPDKDQEIIKTAVLKKPGTTVTEFRKNNPWAKWSDFTYYKYRNKFLTEAGRLDEISTSERSPGSTKKLDSSVVNIIRKSVLKDNHLTHGDFLKLHPKVLVLHSSYLRYRKKILEGANTKDEALAKTKKYTRRLRNLTYRSGWTYPVDKFLKNPIDGLYNLIDSLAGSFELVEIKKMDEETEKWVPTLEIREIE